MSKLLHSMLLISLFTIPVKQVCTCQKAIEDDVPHGANEDIEYTEKSVRKLYGKVTWYGGTEPFNDAVVEIYAVADADKNLKSRDITNQRVRQDACITTSDGSFCFPDLPSGRYVLRAGTRDSSGGMNEVYIRVTLDRRWWRKLVTSGKPIEFDLTAGT